MWLQGLNLLRETFCDKMRKVWAASGVMCSVLVMTRTLPSGLCFALMFIPCFFPAGGCGTDLIVHSPDGGDPFPDGGDQTLPDGFLAPECIRDSDCKSALPCLDTFCDTARRMCETRPRPCVPPLDICSEASCDPVADRCVYRPANEGMACMAPGSTHPATCIGGRCDEPEPLECLAALSLFAACDDPAGAFVVGAVSGPSAISSYTCADSGGLTGPEKGYYFEVLDDADVTITLKDATVDLDLLVLEGPYCSMQAPCVATSFTAGSGNEKITFKGKGAVQAYTVVVDGRGGATGTYRLEITCGAP